VTPLAAIGSFAALAGLQTIVPGLDTAQVVRSAVTQGRRNGFATAFGIQIGTLIWGAAAALGISALLIASRLAFDVLRIAGAAYLIALGITMLWRSWRRADRPPAESFAEPAGRAAVQAAPRRNVLGCFARGITTNLLNPKAGVFYVAVMPQFIPVHSPHLLMGITLAGVHDLEGLTWFTLLITTVHLTRRWLQSKAVHRAMDRITGIVLVGFGVRLALSRS